MKLFYTLILSASCNFSHFYRRIGDHAGEQPGDYESSDINGCPNGILNGPCMDKPDIHGMKLMMALHLIQELRNNVTDLAGISKRIPGHREAKLATPFSPVKEFDMKIKGGFYLFIYVILHIFFTFLDIFNKYTAYSAIRVGVQRYSFSLQNCNSPGLNRPGLTTVYVK